MQNKAVFTSTISLPLNDWLSLYAKEKGVTRRKVLEEALTNYQKQIQKKALKESFQRASKDRETMEMTDWGLEDYNRQLKK